jgi:two-component system NtrC family sensor kinase
MKTNKFKQIDTSTPGRNLAEDIRILSNKILLFANRGLPRIDFVREISKMLIDISRCDAVELRLKRGEKYYRCEMVRDNEQPFRWEYCPCVQAEDRRTIPCSQDDSGTEKLCRDLILSRFDPTLPFFTKKGSFWTNNLSSLQTSPGQKKTDLPIYDLSRMGDYGSLAIFPLVIDDDNLGLLQLKKKQEDYFTPDQIRLYEGLAQTLGVALIHRHAQVALRERVKELTCLYGIARLVARSDISLENLLQSIVELLPPAWLYPEISTARIILNGNSYLGPNFREGGHTQSADIVVSGKKRGVVEVKYVEEKPELDEGPFLKEERSLIDAVAREMSLIIERRQAEEEKVRLQNQLMHADRLATIGQLAAGVAHELNEPLGNILGFAQLAAKCKELSPQAVQDIEKIVNASLHAREVVKKLLIFARQMPTKKVKVNLNQMVEEGLYFFESRCTKEGIELIRSLSPNLPEITADPAQLHQVLVNLVVNAIQAMPRGGKLTIETLSEEGHVSLIVEDTGAGMSEQVMKQIFLPFFTTKEVGQGTGLGLSVVHGIISSHGGLIRVESKIGSGSRFEIQLPVPKSSEEKESE